MKKALCLMAIACLIACDNNAANEINILGLKAPVEILRDNWGINHIYAQNQHDLFFAQGYAAAKDRLFQFEIWRRQATGTVAEILGQKALKRDIGTRLFKFRGDMTTEMNHYHEDGEEIITAYTNGVNAYIDEMLSMPDSLPIEFKILGISPQKWTPDVVISRHQGLLGNIGAELQVGRAVAEIGEKKVKELSWFHPKDPDIQLDPAINSTLLKDDILELYNAYRRTVRFNKEDVLPAYRSSVEQSSLLAFNQVEEDSMSLGSNNWVVSGDLMEDGNTYMANDPHRTIAVPSLRYMTHLIAPGWDVIGGGEPEIPGISIGHNNYGSWGLTVFRTDGEDLMVYELNPANQNQYKYKGDWVDMEAITENITIKGQADETVELKYTKHGPVTYVDEKNNVAYAVRAAWLEPGGSPYLASLRMDQAKTWEEFREACNYSHIPGENMIWADKEGNIGWQAVGIAPIRRNFSGLVPVPGDGRYEWDGYLPIIEKPNALNPAKGFWSSANQNVTPDTYTEWDAIGFSWSDPYRGDRVSSVLSSGTKMNMEDMKALQVDYKSLPAEMLSPMLMEINFEGQYLAARNTMNDWDQNLNPESIAAAIYVSFENQLRSLVYQEFVPENVQPYIRSVAFKKIMDWVIEPSQMFGRDAINKRNKLVAKAFKNGVDDLNKRLGTDMSQWQYGQANNKHITMNHALGRTGEEGAKLNLGPLPRGGNSYTPGSTGGNMNQSSGASFRMIVNTGDWDAAVGTNSPGQSGNPSSPFYSNLFEPWSKDQYFPVYYSRSKIEQNLHNKTTLIPNK
jgi:penicillin G amidase